MSRTVCSWCKAPLVLKDDILVCGNTDCPACDEKYLHEELNRTRKALDAALCSLQDIAESNGDFITGSSTTLDAQEYAEMMLDKIKTALEQKDVK